MSSEVDLRKESTFESIKHEDNRGEYWLGRELGSALGYTNWKSFSDVIHRAKIAITRVEPTVENHFEEVLKVVMVGYNNTTSQEIRDIRLTRYACYVIAQNGNPTIKPKIAEAQSYFAMQTRRQELTDQYNEDMARLARRQEFTESDKRLSANIMEAGISPRGLAGIKSQGDKIFFGGNTNKDMKKRFGTGDKPWANRAHNVVLAGKTLANEMTAANIENYGIGSYQEIMHDNNDNNTAVRKTISEQQGAHPEEFPPAEDTETVKRRITQRNLGQLE